MSLTGDVVEFTIARLQKLPQATQAILKLAACMGNQFDLNTLSRICPESKVEITDNLWPALQGGLVIPEGQIYRLYTEDEGQNTLADCVVEYRFLHDCVQQAAYSLIPADEVAAFHLSIGESWLKNLTEAEIRERTLDIVGHFNLCLSLLTTSEQRERAIELNLIAANQAHAATAYAAAFTYADTAIELLEQDSWHRQRDLTLSLYNTSAEAAFLAGKFATARARIATIIEKSRNVLESINAYEILISLFQAQHQEIQSLEIAISVLRQLNLDLPEYPTEADIQQEIAEVDLIMGTRNILDIANL